MKSSSASVQTGPFPLHCVVLPHSNLSIYSILKVQFRVKNRWNGEPRAPARRPEPIQDICHPGVSSHSKPMYTSPTGARTMLAEAASRRVSSSSSRTHYLLPGLLSPKQVIGNVKAFVRFGIRAPKGKLALPYDHTKESLPTLLRIPRLIHFPNLI